MSRNPEQIAGPGSLLAMPSIDRRCFLLGTFGVAALMAFIPTAVSASVVDFRDAARWISGNFREIRSLGIVYLRKGESGVDAMSDLLGEWRKMPERFSDVLSRRIKDDFANERVVVIDGWVVTETEAAFCALCVSLENPES